MFYLDFYEKLWVQNLIFWKLFVFILDLSVRGENCFFCQLYFDDSLIKGNYLFKVIVKSLIKDV